MMSWITKKMRISLIVIVALTLLIGSPAGGNVNLNQNTIPVAVADTYQLIEDTVLIIASPGVLLNDSDGDGDPFVAQKVSDPLNGILNLAGNGSFTYQPNQGFVGIDSFTYWARDAADTSPAVTVTLEVVAQNEAPLSNPDRYFANSNFGLAANSTLLLNRVGVLHNDLDPNGDSLTAILINSTYHGTLDFASDGTFIYLPEDGFSGFDNFTYVASDGLLTSNETLVLIEVGGQFVGPDFYETDQDTFLNITDIADGFMANDAVGLCLSPFIFKAPIGNATLTSQLGQFSYMPYPQFFGIDIFTYGLRCIQPESGATIIYYTFVSITVHPTGTLPSAVVEVRGKYVREAIFLDWSPPLDNGGYNVSFNVNRAEGAGSTDFEFIGFTQNLNFKDTDVMEGQVYRYSITTRNALGWGDPSPTITVVAVGDGIETTQTLEITNSIDITSTVKETITATVSETTLFSDSKSEATFSVFWIFPVTIFLLRIIKRKK